MTCTIIDIDECDLERDNCDGNATCHNTDGSFECNCKNGYSGNGVTCDSKWTTNLEYIWNYMYILFQEWNEKYITTRWRSVLKNNYPEDSKAA